MLRFVAFKPILKADKPKTRVKGAHKAKRVDALAKRMQRAIQVDLLRGIKTFKKRISKKAMLNAWETKDYDAVTKTIPWEKLHDDLKPFSKTLFAALEGAAEIGKTHLPAPAKEMQWSMNNPKVRGFVEKKTGKLIVDINREARDHVREVVARSFTHGLNPKQVADEIVDSIGLHKRYRTALRTFTLKQQDIHAKDKDYTVMQNNIAEYKERLLAARSLAVARTEIRQATNQGQREVWKEAADQGYIDKEKAKRIFVIDGNPCEICEPMDGEEATLDEGYWCEALQEYVEPGEVHPNCECIEILELGD